MAVYSYQSPDYYEALTTPSIRASVPPSSDGSYDVGAILMGSDGEDAPVAMMLELPPGTVLPRHGHDTHRVEVVVRGSMTLPDGRVAKPGDVLETPRGTYYGPHTAGSEGVLTVEIFAQASGLPPSADPDEVDPATLEQFEQARRVVQAGLSDAGLLRPDEPESDGP